MQKSISFHLNDCLKQLRKRLSASVPIRELNRRRAASTAHVSERNAMQSVSCILYYVGTYKCCRQRVNYKTECYLSSRRDLLWWPTDKRPAHNDQKWSQKSPPTNSLSVCSFICGLGGMEKWLQDEKYKAKSKLSLFCRSQRSQTRKPLQPNLAR